MCSLKNEHTGERFTVIHCEGAISSFFQALASVEVRKHSAFTNGIIHQIQRLADGHRMSKENFPQEGELPKKKGQHRAKKFNALKRIPVRGYCWHSERNKNTYYISHYVFKNYDKLKDRDSNIVGNNWRRIEENGDER